VPFSVLGGPTLIQDVFVAGRSNDVQVVYGDIEIRMGLTPISIPGTNWSQNNPNPTTVYRGPLRITFKNGVWRGIGLPALYVYAPTQQEHLCFEVIVWNVIDTGGGARPNFYFPLSGTSTSPGGAVPRTYLLNWVQGGAHTNPTVPGSSSSDGCKMGLLLGNGNMVVLGQGCAGSSSNVPEIGSSPGTWPQVATVFNVLLTSGKPTSIALMALGSSDTKWGVINLPLELSGSGAPGCHLWNNYLTIFPALVDASGNASVGLPIPPPVFGLRVMASWLNLDASANSAGFTTSSYAKLIIGS
jgi:hypothetical protein